METSVLTFIPAIFVPLTNDHNLDWYKFNVTLQRIDSAVVDDLFASVDKKAYYKRFIKCAIGEGIAISTIATYLGKDEDEIVSNIDEINNE